MRRLVGGLGDDGQVSAPAELRKARGAFFTPPAIAQFVARWALRDPADRVLEPSCGEAAFLTEAVRALAALSPDADVPVVDGVEIHQASAREARRQVQRAGGRARIRVADFFTLTPTPQYDAVIGNPPFVRYQNFRGEARANSREAALRAGVSMSGLASSWAAFTVHSALFLKPGGRLGLVVPAELLSVNYAGSVRRFLLESFTRVNLVLFSERVFPEVQEEVVLVLAEGFGTGHTDHAMIFQAQNADDLDSVLAVPTKWRPADPADKWTPLLLSDDALHIYTDLLTRGHYAPLREWGETTLGMVTGNNKFFAVSPSRAKELDLKPADLVRISPPGSRHLRGLSLSPQALRELGKADAATWLLRPKGEPSAAAWRYIAAGEAAGVHDAYKCRVRSPWWRVPLVAPADLFLTYMNADTPRITTNDARAHHLNSVHGLYLRPETRSLGTELLPLASLTSMTLLGAETVGRSYGGGILKLEPREADRLPVPSPALVAASRDELLAAKPQVAALLRTGKLHEAARTVDEILLMRACKMKRSSVDTLNAEFRRLALRRAGRA